MKEDLPLRVILASVMWVSALFCTDGLTLAISSQLSGLRNCSANCANPYFSDSGRFFSLILGLKFEEIIFIRG